MKGFIDERHKALPVVEHEFFFLSEERFWIWVRSSTKQYRMNWTVMSLHERDSGVFVVHIDAVKGGSNLLITIKKGKLGKLKGSIY
jgi:hypothetical protein